MVVRPQGRNFLRPTYDEKRKGNEKTQGEEIINGLKIMSNVGSPLLMEGKKRYTIQNVVSYLCGLLLSEESLKNGRGNKRLSPLEDSFWIQRESDLTFSFLTFMSVSAKIDSLSLSHLFYGCSRVSLSVSPYRRLVSP